MAITAENAPIVKLALRQGRHHQHTIAAYFGENQGRVSEIKNGLRFRDILPADELPANFPPRDRRP